MFIPIASQSFPVILQWVIHHGYLLISVIMVIEGPIITIASALAASLGYLNIFIIFLLAFLTDIAGDFIWYAVGYFGRLAVINKYGRYFGASIEREKKLRKLLEKHSKKVLLAIKISPVASTLALVVVGNSHFPLKRFAKIVSLISIPKTMFFVIFGYFFGYSYTIIAKYFNKNIYSLLIISALAFCLFLLYRKITIQIAKKFENQL
ncbi:MAG: VTT domain-containing protein [Candidatus Gribaldobacteria bacterium]|nr:VTT domain-containing protein [Candidatus Gribaldobacteria bacterium]